MKKVVVTGSTRGIGFGLAEAFLAQGCHVIISGRRDDAVQEAVSALRQSLVNSDVAGFPCDVRDEHQVQTLWDQACASMGQVDIWVNNAGISGMQGKIWELPYDHLRAVIETNILGAILGSQVAARGMLAQGTGEIYNMLGLGSDGRMRPGLVTYGMSKAALAYFTRGLVQEAENTPLIIGSLQPGMVITDMIMDQYQDRPEDLERVRRIFSIIASRVEDVAPWLVARILSNTKSGVKISYSSSLKIAWRFMSAPFIRRDPFGEGD